MNGMIEASDKMRTVRVNDRGQIVIPEEMREDLGIRGDTVLVLVERGDEILVRKESDVLSDLEGFWRTLAHRSIEAAWGEEDQVWDEHYEGEAS